MRARATAYVIASVITTATLGLIPACSDTPCEEKGTCNVAPGDSGGTPDGSFDVADASPDVQVPEGCDVNADAKDAPKCVVSDFGIFVDAIGGNDGNTGTKELPVKTLTAALTKLAGKPRIYVCEGTYGEAVKVTSAVSIYGGFACGTWSYTGAKAKISPSARGVALSIANASSAMVIADVEATALDAVDAGESSIAMLVANASKVTLRRVQATAGKGMSGTDAANAADFSPANAPDGTSGASGGAQTPNPMCATSIGGAGGKDGATSGASGQVAVNPVFPTTPLSNGLGGSSAAADCGAGSSGRNGSYGLAGTSGTGATKLGELTATGWEGAEGAVGGKGGDGQGGGGGAQVNAGGVGGSGGPGGCGGAGGAKGTAGGSSIALAVFQSAVVVEQSSLVAKDAGRGGNGGKGGKAQLASTNSSPPNSGIDACSGGIGGIGGSGGGGGGGAGGVSAGILYKGMAPKLDGADVTGADTHASVMLGQKGAAGLKGAGGDAARTNAPASRAGTEGTDGIAGEAKAVMNAP